MQISSENYITVLTEQIKALIVENAQLKAHILDLESNEKKTEEQSPSEEENEKR
ncbi:hypothetical protein ACIA4Q_02470 [Lactobacillus delbrueckii subsp. bulgaricus]